jgi:hypothetical protein
MFRISKLVVAVVAILALSASSAMAQGYWDAGAKASGRFGTGFYSGGMRSARVYRAAPVYAAPQIVQTMPAPMAAPSAPQIAQAPTDRRSFSVEPSQGQPAASVPAAAPQVTRSYSYEPAAPAFRSPVRSGWSGMPTYLLPAADSRKHGG